MKEYNIDGVEIPFDITWNSIAISLSGGADSALMAYLLCGLISKDTVVHCISHTRMWKTRPWQGWDSIKVFEWLNNTFPDIKFQRHTNFISPELEYGNIGPSLIDEYGKKVSGDNIEIRAFAEYVCYSNNIDAYYNAVTRNPKEIDLGGMKERDIDQSLENSHLRLMKHMSKWAIHPFRFVDKSWVIKQYKRLDIEELLSITRSCEGEFEGLDYTTYKPGQKVPTCGECFWCKERDWAVNKNC
jgi:hypothetical protein